MKYCKKCKVKYKDDYSFCPDCGNELDGNVVICEGEETKNGKVKKMGCGVELRACERYCWNCGLINQNFKDK